MTCTDIWEDKRKVESTTHRMLPRVEDQKKEDTSHLDPVFVAALKAIESNKPYDKDYNAKHYKLNEHGIECIDAIEASMSKEQFVGALKANVIKYIWRMDYKATALENTKKARWYLNKLIETLEK